MVIETIAYCVGILSLVAAVFVLSREVVRLRHEITSMHVELTMACNAVDALYGKISVLSFKRYGCVADALSGLSARVRELCSLVLSERALGLRFSFVRKCLKRCGRLSK